MALPVSNCFFRNAEMQFRSRIVGRDPEDTATSADLLVFRKPLHDILSFDWCNGCTIFHLQRLAVDNVIEIDFDLIDVFHDIFIVSIIVSTNDRWLRFRSLGW